MKNLIYILPILIVAFFAYLFFGMESENVAEDAVPSAQGEGVAWEAKSEDGGGITVTVVPEVLGRDQGEWRFKISFDTHSGSLDHDMLAVATQSDGKGNRFAPLRWEGADTGGHHREGTLVFRAINPAPSAVELRIADVGGVPERIFQWDIP